VEWIQLAKDRGGWQDLCESGDEQLGFSTTELVSVTLFNYSNLHTLFSIVASSTIVTVLEE
jgi:hypothetical protein